MCLYLPEIDNFIKNTDADRDLTASCDKIDSLSVGDNPEATGLTTFLSEACDSTSVLGKHYFKSPLAPAQKDIQDLTSYFARPRIIASFPTVLGSTNHQFATQLSPFTTFTNWFPFGKDRLAGVFGARFTTVFTLQVNATPFMQGVIGLCFQYGEIMTASSGSGLTPRGVTPGMQTNLPHVRLDLAENTMVQLRVPFMSNFEFLPVISVRNIGTLTVFTLLPPLAGASAGIPTVKVYVHLEDMELIGATNPESNVVALQSGKKLNPVAEEYEDASKPLSSGVHMMGKSLSYISQGVPSLASLAGPPIWALGLAARIIRYFGYAKPTVVTPPVKVWPQAHINEFNVDLPSDAAVVGYMASNTLAPGPNFAHTEVDEMALPFILGSYSQLCMGTMSTTNTVGTTIYATIVSPSSFWFRSRLTGAAPFCNISAPRLSPAVGTTSFIPTNIFYLGSCFRFWKGGFKFRFTFAKTKFHTGRVLVNYDPTPTFTNSYPSGAGGGVFAPGTLTAPFSSAPQPTGYSAVWDLKDGNVFEFEVPYMAFVPYLGFYDNSGSLTMTLTDNILAPSTVSSTVQFLVEVKAMDDFELSVPCCPRYPPYNTINPTVVRYQSGKMLGVATPDDAQHCIGEIITSVKQLITMPKIADAGSVPATANDNIYLMPWWYGNRISSLTAPVVFPKETFGFGNYFANAYAFVRGSTDYHFYPLSVGAADVYMSVAPIGVDSATAGVQNDPTNSPYSNMPRAVHTSAESGMHVRLPAHQKIARYETDIFWNVPWIPNFQQATKVFSFQPALEVPYEIFRLVVRNQSASPITVQLTRAAGDDAGLSMYMGPPLLATLFAPTGSLYDPDSGIWN